MPLEPRFFSPVASDAEIVWGEDKFRPPFEELPEDFRYNGGDGRGEAAKWSRLFNQMFYDANGKTGEIELAKKPDLTDEEFGNAFRNIRAVMKSWASKHEYKTAGVAYMLSLVCDDWWFSSDPDAAEKRAKYGCGEGDEVKEV